jgi:hypothetical protein
MNMRNAILPASKAVATLALPPSASAQELLTGDTRLICEAILCLSSGSRPNECTPSLRRYFGINRRSWRDTVGGRLNFLKLCPAVSDTSQNVPSLVGAIANGAGRCDPTYLNATLGREEQRTVCADKSGSASDANNSDSGETCTVQTVTVIDNEQPAYCAAYAGHAYANQIGARHVGDPLKGGRGIDSSTGQ